METATMGQVLAAALVEDLADVYEVRKGTLRPEDVRRVEVPEALVDTGATMLSLPGSLIRELGLNLVNTRAGRTSAGVVPLNAYSGVRITIQGRQCISDVIEVPESCPVLVGQIPLEALDLVVDMSGRRLIGNPEHGGEHMIDMF